MSRERLTSTADWERRYTAHPIAGAKRQRGALMRALIPRNASKSYSEECLWKRLLPRFLDRRPDRHVLEIGCAPGGFLRKFEQNFGCVPHGVDFSPTGLAQTRENFQEWGYDPKNITQADILDPAFQRDSRNRFDVVFSRGFIEHFTGELPAIIQAHVDAVRPGGLLIVTIPNYRGLNYALGRLTISHLYPEHNFTIMHSGRFRGLFELPELESLWCGLLGGFNLGLMDNGSSSKTLWVTRRLQALFNIAFRLIPPPETRWTSPQLVYVGRKRDH
jgi:SAM-dependent methyltransferase